MTTNYAIDPSFENFGSGVSTSGTLYVITDDPTVKFAGTRSKRGTRTATSPSNVISGCVGGATASTNALRTLITPGQVISASCKVMIDRPGRVKMDYAFRDAGGTTIGALTAGTYSDAPNPGEWNTAKVENLTAPANAAYVYFNVYAALPSGAPNTSGGESAWFDALMVTDGPVALPYFDGSTPDDGYVEHRWNGPVNASTSTELPAVASPVRQQIAAAASIPGVRVAPNFRQTIKVGDGMVRLARVDFPNRLGGVNTWQVLIVLPQDIAAAERWLDTKIPALREAVGAELTVASIVPQELVTDAGKVPVVVLTGNRETE